MRFSWIRRARRDADSWEPAEIPLGETSEAYRLDILGPDGAVLRRLEASSQSALYAEDDEAADFGGPQTAIQATVAQVSAVAGRGSSNSALVPVAA